MAAQDRRVADERHPHQTADRPAAGSRQLVEQPLRFFKVGGVEALGEPVVDGCEQVTRLAQPAPFE